MKQWILTAPQIAFDTFFFGYNPRLKAGYRNVPFILRPNQIKLVDELKDCIVDNPHDLLIDKSRDEGATEIIVGFYDILWLIVPETSFLVGSRKEQYVDSATEIKGNRVIGDHRCLFYKLLYKIATAPVWLRPRFVKSHMRFENLDNGSLTSGEATNPNFGAGDRRTSILVDEMGRVESNLALSIRESVSDVSDSVVYNSTHWYGWGHAFGRLRRQQLGQIKVFLMPWYLNPDKSKGFYISPEFDKLEILDKNYKFPENYPFILDGKNKFRSIWYDKEAKRRSPRDLACNVDMNPAMAGDIFFDPQVLDRLRSQYIKQPKYTGSFTFDVKSKSGNNRIYNIKFRKNVKDEFKWWLDLERNRPDQEHTYLVSCDISLGTGGSNSVAKIYDLVTFELAGMFLTPHLTPSDFCDYVMAICNWVGGQNRFPFLVWEANGPGILFDQRRKLFGYSNIFLDTITRSKTPKRTKRPGFYTTKTSKYDALLELRAALAEGLKKNPTGKYLRIYDELTFNEYDDYIFYDNGDIGLSGNVTETGEAKKAHGDTVITDAMAVHCLNFAPKSVNIHIPEIYIGTLAYRRAMRKQEEEQEERESLWLVKS